MLSAVSGSVAVRSRLLLLLCPTEVRARHPRLSTRLEKPLSSESGTARLGVRSLEVARSEVDVFEGEWGEALFGEKFGVLDVSLVEAREFVRSCSEIGDGGRLSRGREIDVDVPNGVLEDLNLFDKVLQRASMSFEARRSGSVPSESRLQRVLLLSHLSDPNSNDLLEFSCSEVTQNRVFPPFVGLRSIGTRSSELELVFESLTELFNEGSEFFILRGERAQEDEDFDPVGEVGVLNDIGEIVHRDGFEDSEVRCRSRSRSVLLGTGEVGRLGLSEEFGTASKGEEESV